MSRVGKKPIKLPAGVKVEVKPSEVKISGKGGALTHPLHPAISAQVAGDELKVVVKDAANEAAESVHGLTRTLLQNIVIGVTDGYKRDLELQGVGYRASVQGQKLNLSVGFSHPVEFALPQGITATVEANTKISLKGADKTLLGLTAARLRKVRPPEPYKGKGIRYAGEVITLKQGKAAGGGK